MYIYVCVCVRIYASVLTFDILKETKYHAVGADSCSPVYVV